MHVVGDIGITFLFFGFFFRVREEEGGGGEGIINNIFVA
jgi:hypothetical protein